MAKATPKASIKRPKEKNEQCQADDPEKNEKDEVDGVGIILPSLVVVGVLLDPFLVVQHLQLVQFNVSIGKIRSVLRQIAHLYVAI